MPHVVLEVPLALAAGLRETVLLQYRMTLEALHLGLEDKLAGDAEVSGGRERLRQLDELLDQLDTPAEPDAPTVRVEAAENSAAGTTSTAPRISPPRPIMISRHPAYHAARTGSAAGRTW